MSTDIEVARNGQAAPRRGRRGWLVLAGVVMIGAGLGYLSYQHFWPSSPTPLAVFAHREEVACLQFTPDGKVLATGGWNGLKLWDVGTPKHPFVRWQHTEAVAALAITADGNTLVSAHQHPGGIVLGHDRNLKVWHVPTGKLQKTLQFDGSGRLDRVAITADGQTVASGSGRLTLWDMATAKPRLMVPKHAVADGYDSEVAAVAFTPDGKVLASGAMDGTIKLWDVATSKEQLSIRAHDSKVGGLTFTPEGKTLISSGYFDHRIKLWDAATGNETASWGKLQHVGQPRRLFITTDGQTLATDDDSTPGTVRLWAVATGRLQATLSNGANISAATITADGKLLGVSWSGPYFRVELWEVSAAEPAPRDGMQPK